MTAKPDCDPRETAVSSTASLVPVSRRRNCPTSREINEAIVTLIDAGAPVEAIRTLDRWNADRIEIAVLQVQAPGDAAELFAGIPSEYLE
jgi:hypothetical protein